MARRYDSRTTIFSPEGRLYQVEYAMEAINHAGIAIGVLGSDGVVLGAEKKIASKLLDNVKGSEKMYKVDDHCAVAVAGITADANILVNYSRVSSSAIQDAVWRKDAYRTARHTQFGGLRPFGVSFLYAGFDEHFGFQLYQSDPSGNYGGWKAAAMGANSQAALSMLKQDYKDGQSLHDSILLAIKVLSKSMDSTKINSEKLE
eukprot:CAMPEP_0113913238 /NCGR_PEP_ID=MMETSP0780_2-20120614/29440_1 /TAXON_ID=652834 /ORGANISM="Palpitomonas bilix" /LENGTH=202 /DNA_ID=CAMNT_0000910423 /DNA_START=107 /DNA_END=711 /DNA_ORIENTATION=- /assembly_acc=CAM_ASM_000599